MSKLQLSIVQNNEENNVPALLVTKLYNMVRRTENGEEIWDAMEKTKNENGEDIYVAKPNALVGSFRTGYTYKEYIDNIHKYFGNTLHITADGYYLLFKDDAVRSILVNSDKCEDHVGITTEDIRKLTNFTVRINGANKQLFRETNITTFDELSKLTNLTKLNQNDFYGCTHLTSIDLSNIREIDGRVFMNCTSLTIDVDMPNLQVQYGGDFMNSNIKSVVNLGDITKISSAKGSGYTYGMFKNCTNLESVHLSELITELDSETFSGCTALKTINIPKGLTTLKGGAFGGCSSLTVPVFYMPNVTSVDRFIFSGSNISIVYMNKLKTMPDGDYVNYQYNSGVFATNRGNKTYKYIYFKDIEYIGSCAFVRCTVNSLIINNVNPPDFGIYEETNNDGTIRQEKIFVAGSITNIYVPATAVEKYKTHDKWSYYADNIKSIELMPKVSTYEEFLEKKEQGDTTLYLIEEYM